MFNLPLHPSSRAPIKQLIRYGLIGVAINASGYIVYLLFTYLGATPKITMTILYLAGTVISFFCNRRLTFEHRGSGLGAGVRYIFAHCFGYIINLTILILLVDKLGYAHQWVQALAIIVVAMYLFLAFKFFVFLELDDPEKAGQ